MKKIILIISCCFFTAASTIAQTPNFVWAKQLGGSSGAYGAAIAVDASGNVYTAGTFNATADFDPGTGTYDLTGGGTYISKLSSAGAFLWARKVDANEAGAIKLDASGNVYITGSFKGTVDFNPGAATYDLTAVDVDDIYILKLDAAGNFVWAKGIGGENYDYGSSIALDAAGNVYTTGWFIDTVDFDPGAGTSDMVPNGDPMQSDIFVLKLTSAGNFVWAKHMGGGSQDLGFCITVDANGNVFTSGHFDQAGDYDPGAGTSTLSGSGIFVSKLDVSGTFGWAKKMGATNGDYAYSIGLDATGNVFLTGIFSGTADFDPGAATFNLTGAGKFDIFIAKLDASGNFSWAKGLGETDDDIATALNIDSKGNVNVIGYFNNTIDFDPGPGTSNLSAANLDVFLLKLNTSGGFVWARGIGSIADESGNAITVDASDNVYATGYFAGTVDFNPGTPQANLVSIGQYSSFVLKWNQAVSGFEEISGAGSLRIYPNPTNGIFNITLSVPSENASIEIYNALGAMVYKAGAAEMNTIDLSDYANGLYVVKVLDVNNVIAIQKIVKQ